MRSRPRRIFPYEPGYQPTWRGRPPRMVPAEAELWTWWLSLTATNIEEMWFDVRMDGIPDQDPIPGLAAISHDDELLRDWYDQSARRCDAIVRRGDRYTIIELRAKADAQTIGELELYDRLSRTEWPQLTFTPPELVTTQINPTTMAVLTAKQIPVVVIARPSLRWG